MIMFNSNSTSSPENSISIFDSKITFSQKNSYYLKEGKIITDENGNEIFNIKDDINRIILYNNNGNPLFNINCNALSYPIEKLIIYSGDMNSKEIATLKLKRSFIKKKYITEFFNQSTKKDEILDLECDSSYSSCEVYYGKKKDGAPLLCKIEKLKTLNEKDFSIELTSNVDNLFMIAIAICIYKINLNTYHSTSY